MSKINDLIKTSALLSGAALVSASAAQAGIFVNPENENILIEDGEDYFFDLNGDGRDDFAIVVGKNSLEEPKEDIGGKISLVEKHVGTEFSQSPGSASIYAIGEQARVLTESGIRKGGAPFAFVDTFAAGDTIDGSVGEESSNGALYVSIVPLKYLDVPSMMGLDQIGPFADDGDTHFVGLSITTFEEGAMGDEGINVYYGWVELLRGSITIVGTGIQTIANTGATIPGGTITVSEPATLPLIALGAVGMAALRRRKMQ